MKRTKAGIYIAGLDLNERICIHLRFHTFAVKGGQITEALDRLLDGIYKKQEVDQVQAFFLSFSCFFKHLFLIIINI